MLICAPPTDPQITSSISAGSTPERSTTACIVVARMSSGRTSASEPFVARPMGLRAAATMTASGISRSFLLGGPEAYRTARRRPRRGEAGAPAFFELLRVLRRPVLADRERDEHREDRGRPDQH